MRSTNTVRMNKNGKISIMQVSDPQDLIYVRRAMVRMLDSAYDNIRPDLVVFTGDNILGNHLLDARFGSRKVAEGRQATLDRMSEALGYILDPLEQRGIPFAMIYGNHDDMNDISKEEQAQFYLSRTCCLPMNTDEPTDIDTYNIPILSSDGERTIFNLWMLDTAWHDREKDKCFEAIKKSAVDFYNRRCASLADENGGKVPSLLFMHIPFAEQRELCMECGDGLKGSVRLRDGRSICLDKSKASGHLGEPPCVCEDEYGMFEAIRANGDVMAVISGHDHTNCFEGTVKGVRLIQTPCASFRCYGNRFRGVRMFYLDENKPGEFETQMLTYDDLCGRGIGARLRYFWDADDLIKYKAGAIGAGVLGLGAAAVKILMKRR